MEHRDVRTSSALALAAGLAALAPAAAAFQSSPPEIEVKVDGIEGNEPFVLCYRQWLNTQIDTVTDTDVVRFFGRAGDPVHVSLRTSAWLDPRVRVLEPSGALLDEVTGAAGSGGVTLDYDLPPLPVTGLYTLILNEAQLNYTGNVRMTLERRLPDVPVPAIDYGPTYSLPLDTAVDHEFVTFQGEQNSMIDLTANCSAWLTPRLRVVAPSGTVFTTGQCDAGSGGCSFALTALILPETGTYTVEVWDAGHDYTGTVNVSIACILGNCPPPRIDVPLGSSYCATNANSTGLPAAISASGSPFSADNYFNLLVTEAPAGKVGLFFFGQNQTQAPFPGGQGNLCVGPPGILRLPGVGTCANGTARYSPDLTALPQGQVFLPGSTWNFQLWFRDKNPGSTTNTSDGVQVTFQ